MKMLKEKFSPVLALTRSADFLNICKPTGDLDRLADNINRPAGGDALRRINLFALRSKNTVQFNFCR